MGRHPRARRALIRPHKKSAYRKPEMAFAHANLFIGLRYMIFFGGEHCFCKFNSPCSDQAASHPRPTLQAPDTFAGRTGCAAVKPGAGQGCFNVQFFESGGNVVVQASGSLNLAGATDYGDNNDCNQIDGSIDKFDAWICTGPSLSVPSYTLSSGPSWLPLTLPYRIQPASSVSGIFTTLQGNDQYFGIDPNYISNTPIVSSATFNGKTLADLGFTTTGLLGTWTIDGNNELIQAYIGPPAPSAPVPGPLPLLGAGAAFGWSRRLRKRIAAPLSRPPQAWLRP
jgi:hypothetical protein